LRAAPRLLLLVARVCLFDHVGVAAAAAGY
jgi:hypothetical protein